MSLIETADLTPFATIDIAKANAMITDATAMAVMAAPCLEDDAELSETQLAAAKAILRGAILRWNDSGNGAVSAQAAGPYSVSLDTRTPRRAMFWPSEISALQKICAGSTDGGAFSIDTAASPMVSHSALCGWGCICPEP